MINKQMTFLILALLFALISIPIIHKCKEGFVSLTPGNFPVSVSEPILFGDYPTKDNMGISMNTYEDNYPAYPVFGSSYGQFTNNVRYWATPDNGQCAPAELCNSLYNEKNVNIEKTPNPVSFSSPQVRVNFYGSHPLVCPTQAL
jgi:hypothetical protein